MADVSFKGRRDDAIYSLRTDAKPAENCTSDSIANAEVIDLSPYLSVLWASRRTIAVSVLLAGGLTGLVTTLVFHKFYRAIAILRPIPKAATAGRIAGIFGGAGAGSS